MMRSSRILLVMLATVLATVASAEAPAVNPAIVPTPKRGWIDAHNDQVAEAIKIKPDLLFLGDSITNGWSNPGRSVWNEHYRPLNAANIAIAGDRIENLLWRLKNGGIGGDIQPKVAVMMIGTNNMRETPEQIAEGVQAILAEIQTRSPGTKTVLIGILPRGERPNSQRVKNAEANSLLASMADQKKIWYLDFGDKFLQPDGALPKELMPDFLHPSKAGYVIWADALDPLLTKLMR